jgi:hypothetical protein
VDAGECADRGVNPRQFHGDKAKQLRTPSSAAVALKSKAADVQRTNLRAWGRMTPSLQRGISKLQVGGIQDEPANGSIVFG